MKFAEFYQKHFKDVRGDFLLLAKEGYFRMKKSIDPIHDHLHAERLFGLLDKFLVMHKKIKNKLDVKVVFLAICWHDTWKAERNLKSVLEIIYGQAAEGIGASKIFEKEAKKYALDKDLIKNVSYVIRKHNTVQFVKRKTLESKIFKDIDKLDSIHLERFEKSGNRKLTKFYIAKISKDKAYFSWTREMLKEERKRFLENFKV